MFWQMWNQYVYLTVERLLNAHLTDGLTGLSLRWIQPSQQQGRRFPCFNSLTVLLTWSFLVSCLFTKVTQQIHSFRASGVRSSQARTDFGLEESAFCKSIGSLWTVPPDILSINTFYLNNIVLTYHKLLSLQPVWFLATYHEKSTTYGDTFFMAGAVGIEPTQMVLETTVLPLYDAPSPILYQTPRRARGKLLSFFVRSLLTTVLAILFNFKTSLGILLVLSCIVIDVTTHCAFHLDTSILWHIFQLINTNSHSQIAWAEAC